MLTALIASAEIAPVPVAQFTAQARTFVESALEHVKLTQHQTPVKSSVESQQVMAEDGRPIRITNYTVEMDDSTLPGVQRTSHDSVSNVNSLGGAAQGLNLSSSSQGLILSATPQQLPLPMRSSLVFSFLIFPDNSVSLRARWSAPQQWSGFAAGQLASPAAEGQVSGRGAVFAEGERELWPSGTESDLEFVRRPTHQSPGAGVLSGLESQATLSGGSVVDESSSEQRSGQAEALHCEIWDGLLGQWCEVDFVEHGVESQTEVPAPGGFESDPAWAAAMSGRMTTGRMIALDFSTMSEGYEADAQVEVSSSAIYQVFIHAPEVLGESASAVSQVNVVAGPTLNFGHSENDVAWSSAEPSDQPRWSTQTLAWIAAAGGLVWAIRPQRGKPFDASAHRTVEG